MVKKSTKPVSLIRNEIILGADAETIRAALEAREQIDVLLAERAEAYRKIAEYEEQVDQLLDEDATFPFPEPELPVASFAAKPKPKKKPAPKVTPEPIAKAVIAPVEPTPADVDSDAADEESTEDSNS